MPQSVKMAKYHIRVLNYMHYLLDITPCDLFPRDKSVLKGTRFHCVEYIREKAVELIEKDSQNCFIQEKIRLHRCRNRSGLYIESDNCLNSKEITTKSGMKTRENT